MSLSKNYDMEFLRTNSSNEDFVFLVKQLDEDLKKRDGDLNVFYSKFNKIDNINHVIVCYLNHEPIGCGAIKKFNDIATEMKRMFVVPTQRGKGISALILKELETWAKDLNYKKCVLETGKKQVEANALYLKNGYIRTENYGQYAGIENSMCYEKILK
jgi:putative acetyltransferase